MTTIMKKYSRTLRRGKIVYLLYAGSVLETIYIPLYIRYNNNNQIIYDNCRLISNYITFAVYVKDAGSTLNTSRLNHETSN